MISIGGNEESLECPKCGTENVNDKNYCPRCGYDFRTRREGVGPVSFAHSEVEFVFEPSGKRNFVGEMLLFGVGLLVALACGGILYPLHAGVLSLLLYSYDTHWIVPLVFWFMVFVGPAILGFLLGLVISYVIDEATTKLKVRNVWKAKETALISGFIAFCVYAGVRFLVLGAKGFETTIDYVKLVEFCVGLLIGSYVIAGVAMREKPFCESCGEYMKRIMFEKIPIRHEDRLVEFAESSKFDEMAALAAAPLKEDGSSCTVSVWYCDSCAENGFLSIGTTMKQYTYAKDGTKTPKSESRLIFSAQVEKSGIEPFIAAHSKLQETE